MNWSGFRLSEGFWLSPLLTPALVQYLILTYNFLCPPHPDIVVTRVK